MGGIQIRAGARETSGKGRLPLAAFLFLTAGVFGILFLLRALDAVDYPVWLVLPPPAALCWALWYSYGRHRKLFYGLFAAAAAGCGLAVLLLWGRLGEQTAHIAGSLRAEAQWETVEVTELALLLGLVLSLLLFALECLIRSHLALYLLTAMLPILSPFLGIRTNVETMLLLVLFQLAFWAIQIAVRSRNGPFLPQNQFQLAGKSGTAMGLVLAISFSAALPLTALHAEKFYSSVYEAEGFVYRSLSTLSGRAGDPVTGGKISRSNNYRTGAPHLRLIASGEPTQAVYLRGFGGGEYTGGDWIRSSDEALFERMIEDLGSPSWSSSISNMYYYMYFVVNGYMQRDEPPPSIVLTIQHINGQYGNAYVPYYSRRQGNWNFLRYFGLEEDESQGYVYEYYEQEDVDIDWDNAAPDYAELSARYQDLQRAYIKEAREAYTQVPTELLPRLTALVEENPLTQLDEITAFILHTLHSRAAYTLTPGWTAFNEDVVEYFLFERGRGFCEHFAVTATLMYRLYGVPARYATGYRVAPSDFEPLENGNYQVVVTDESAHAWTEIFLEDYGWTPIEVTPGSDGSMAASYPGLSTAQLRQIWRDQGWDVPDPRSPEDLAGGLSGTSSPEGADFLLEVEIDWEKHRDLLLVIFSCLSYSVLLLPLFLDYRRLRLLRRAETMDCRAAFSRLIQVLHFGGLLPEYDGEEDDFSERLAEAVPNISQEEAEDLVEAVSKAAFGPPASDAREEEFVRLLYRRAAAQVYARLGSVKKLIFKFIRAFG